MATLRLDVQELEELKRVIQNVEKPKEMLQEVLNQVEIALFQETIQEGDWFRWIEADGVFEAFEVDRDSGKVWFFDPYTQQDTWVRLETVAPVTKEEIEQAKKHHEELNLRYEDRCGLIEEYLGKKYPGATFTPVDHLYDETFPEDIEMDGKVIGRYAWTGWPNHYHYTVNMAD